ncbi:glycoside hydrolase family 92 protein [Puniceicoccales bacterium CK1056]|uniref:Glycoside hydrolase family 92 protein n=1 Tax=Oceanipulchritudo coccoides TaxID=2706888 RepID=A0A6B2M0L1_9BACT|nr:GH92 family glycosyl hydrolase [Oceanipulchritudo coccoides]NDV61567.1 glycoside hydrolase family 92 protein [Oceanipulchritudo coccoides]
MPLRSLKRINFCLGILPVVIGAQLSQASNGVDHANLFIGTGYHGHTFPAATLPYGAVAPGPDCSVMGWHAASGYHYDKPTIMGFSQTHLSGTGLIELGDFMLMPTVGQIQLEPGKEEQPETGYRSRFSHDDETANPGYYQVRLTDYDINVELTATTRVALHRYTYPEGKQRQVVMDMEHHIGVPNSVKHAYLRVHDPYTVTGYRITDTWWAKSRFIYFCLKFSEPMTGHNIHDRIRKLDYPNIPEQASSKMVAVFQFAENSDKPLLAKISVSPVSMRNARENLETELPHWDFEKIRQAAGEEWAAELGKIEASGPDRELEIFYSALYHTMIHPDISEDVNGEYRGIDKEIHKAEGYTNHTVFSLWDTFRAVHPLFTIIQQERTKDFIASMLAHQSQSAFNMLPSWSMHHNENFCMIGYHAVPVIVDAWHKGLVDAPDEVVLKAVLETTTQPGAPRLKFRNYPQWYGQQHYLRLGYFPDELTPAGTSITLEHAYDDWTVSLMAETMGNVKVAKEYQSRGQNYRNVWDSKTGFFRGKLENGNFFEPFSPRAYHREDHNDREFTEGNAWQYLFFVPHDVYGLIDLIGGPEEFSRKLDTLFTLPPNDDGTAVGDVSGLIGDYAHGNEPCHHVAYLYNYVGQPWKAQERIHDIANRFYHPTPEGLIGNEDAGQMSAWYVMSAMGFYPVNPCGGIYVIGSPLLPGFTINLENGKQFEITANGLSEQNIYIQSVRLNGNPLKNVWITHDSIMNGGSLEFEMGPEPSNWGAGSDLVPFASGKI